MEFCPCPPKTNSFEVARTIGATWPQQGQTLILKAGHAVCHSNCFVSDSIVAGGKIWGNLNYLTISALQCCSASHVDEVKDSSKTDDSKAFQRHVAQ